MVGQLGNGERVSALMGLLILACSSSSKTLATGSCSPGELEPCELSSGCVARKTCNPDGRTFGPCQCVSDAGPSGGSSGTSGAGGTSGGPGGTNPGGNGGTLGGPAGAAGSPPTGGTGPGGSAGVPPTGGAAGAAGGPGGVAGAPPTGGTAGVGGTGGGAVGSAGTGGACLSCVEALSYAALPIDPRICPGSRQPYTNLYNCVCAHSICAPVCAAHCADPINNPLPSACQACALSECIAEGTQCYAN